jgi:hypothetical protein
VDIEDRRSPWTERAAALVTEPIIFLDPHCTYWSFCCSGALLSEGFESVFVCVLTRLSEEVAGAEATMRRIYLVTTKIHFITFHILYSPKNHRL